MKKVSVVHLERGMYVAKLDRPWTETGFREPFVLQGFTIESDKDLQIVKSACRFVYIDPSRGRDTKFHIDDVKDSSLWSDTTAENLLSADLPPPAYEDRIKAEDEQKVAREIKQDTGKVFTTLLKRTEAGRSINIEIVRKTVTKLVESVIRNPDALIWLTKMKHGDSYSYTHSMTICVLALAVGRHLGIPQSQLNVLGTAALLQDVGKTRLPALMVKKPSKYTEQEYELSKMHVGASVGLLRDKTGASEAVLDIVAEHHERFDGSGYPRGLRGNTIGMLSTISGMVDTYAAMTSLRPYRTTMTSFESLMRMYDMRNKQFPAAIVEHFIQCIGIFSIGSFVQLDTHEVGIIVARNRIKQLTPRVMIVLDSEGNRAKNLITIDLAKQQLEEGRELRQIVKVVNPEDYNLDPAEFFA